MWKTPGYGYCKDWLAHLWDNEFDMVAHDIEETVGARREAGTPKRYISCHTGIMQDYTLEGHVPTCEIKCLLQEHPKAVGLAVPSTPLGVPGMNGPTYSNRRVPYNVLLIGLDGQATIFRMYS